MYPGKTEPMIKNTTHSSIGCNGMANNDDYHGLEEQPSYGAHASFGCLCFACVRVSHLLVGDSVMISQPVHASAAGRRAPTPK